MRKQLVAATLVAGVGIATVSFGQQPAGQEVVSTPQIHTEVESGTTTVGLQSFMDFGHISNQADGNDVNPTGTGFDVKRFYLIVDHKFDDVWAANLTTDAEYLADKTTTVTIPPSTKTTTLVTGSGSGGVTEVFIKKLYLQATLNDAFVVHVGSYTSPWAPFVEGQYGYRYIEKTQTDRLGFANTADWGLNATGHMGGNGGNMFNYSLSIVNGAGFKNPSRSKYVDWEGRVGFIPVEWLTIGAGFYSGHLGQISTSNQDFPNNTASRWDVLLSVHAAGFHIGAEYWDAKNYKTGNTTSGAFGTSSITTSSSTPPVSDEGDGVSSWISYDFNSQWSVFGRYDTAKPSKDVLTSLKDNYFNLGINFKPRKGVDLALVYKDEKVNNGSLSVSSADANGSYTIGGVSPTTDGHFSEIGVYTQFTF
jgi:hypothetical protein